ncbi:hypothetical protein ACFWF7_38630 [Nocardia sp. NPDC060256]|uniref:hypothetical protein n=1 Tax=unclassified Nocardia TaxID=2637762 RepID=UPI0036507FB9
MREALDGDTVFADMMMMRQVDSRIVLLVEGEEDTDVVDPHLNEDNCRSEIGHGKHAVLRAAELVTQNKVSGVLFAVDKDFDDPTKIRLTHRHISVSEYYDLHSDILINCHESIKRLTICHTKRDKFKIPPSSGSITTTIIEIAGPLGMLRYWSVKNQIGLNLAKFPSHLLVEASERNSLFDETVHIAYLRSTGLTVSETDMINALKQMASANSNLAPFCQSHDMIDIFSALIRQRWGGSVGKDYLANALRASVAFDCFQRLQIYKDLDEWGQEYGTAIWTASAA